MPQNTPTQAESVELTKSLRAAIEQNHVEKVLQAAGTSRIEGRASEVLRETSAAQMADLVAQDNLEASEEAPAPDAKIAEAAQAAFDQGRLETAFEEAGIDPQQGQETAAREMARIAGFASQFAEAEDRAVCHNCSAVGAARAATQLSAPQQSW